jgi:uncharacterized pyridoxamine 5'-phosphate oxidase family protein
MKKETAEQLKCRIIDYLLLKHPDMIIGNEIMFGSSRNAVDLLAISGNQLIAIEIKSPNDNLKRLSHQIKEYLKVYDKIIVFCSQDKIDEAQRLIKDKPIGLCCISEDTIKILIKPKINNSTNKKEMLASIPVYFLKKIFKLNRKSNSDETRHQLSQKSKQIIHSSLLNFYREKLSKSFNLYMKDKGEVSCIDDIPILSLESQIL